MERERGAMLEMCIKDAVEHLPLYNFNLLSQILIGQTHLIDGYTTFSHHLSAIRVPEIDNVEYEKKNHIDWIEEWAHLRIWKGEKS